MTTSASLLFHTHTYTHTSDSIAVPPMSLCLSLFLSLNPVLSKMLHIAILCFWPGGCRSLAFQERTLSRVSGSLRASRPPQTRAEKARKMGMILVMPIKAAKMKLPRMAANLQTPFMIPNAVPLQRQTEIEIMHKG